MPSARTANLGAAGRAPQAIGLLAKLAARNILRQKARTAAALAAIAVGVTSVILSGGFVDDIFFQLREAIIHSQTGHVQIGPKGYFGAGSRSPEKYIIKDIEQEKSRVLSVAGVIDVMARLHFSGLLNNGSADFSIIGEGVEPEKEAALGVSLLINQGRQLTDKDQYGMLIGEGLAKALQLRAGDLAVIMASTSSGAVNTLDLEVVGVFQSISQEYDARAVKIPLRAAQELLNTNGANIIVVALEKTSETEKVASVLRERTLWKDLEIKTWLELNDFYRSAVELYDRQFGVLRAIILVMVVLGVMNTVNMTVLERVGEFGTMRALGNRQRDVVWLVVTEGALLGLLGATSGVVLGILLAPAISLIGIPMPPPPNANMAYTAHIRVVPSVVVGAFLIGLAASALASVPPGLRASRPSIAEALRQNV
jgi:putative ABC transport system permease protein